MGAIIVTGIPGVGKTTVMEALAKRKGLDIVVYGSVMFEVAHEKGWVEDRDDMRRMEPEAQREAQREAAVRIAAMGEVIVDTHCSVKTPKGYLPGLPAWVLEALRPATLVLVEAEAQQIHARRAADATRKRDPDPVETIAEHQEVNRRFAAAYAALTGATVMMVQNPDGGVEGAVERLLPVVA